MSCKCEGIRRGGIDGLNRIKGEVGEMYCSDVDVLARAQSDSRHEFKSIMTGFHASREHIHGGVQSQVQKPEARRFFHKIRIGRRPDRANIKHTVAEGRVKTQARFNSI